MKTTEPQGICDETIFTGFFKEQAKSLRNFLYFKFGNEALADDVTQEAFIKLWQNCSEVRQPRSFIYKVARNAALNHVAYRKVVLTYAENNPGQQIDYESPEFIAEHDEFRQKFDKAIASLTEAQREALLLNRIEGKKYREIAEMLGISIKAVEKRIHGAMVTLGKQIENLR
jgi:RNA polymerase sigma factor (sigma-70 family)